VHRPRIVFDALIAECAAGRNGAIGGASDFELN